MRAHATLLLRTTLLAGGTRAGPSWPTGDREALEAKLACRGGRVHALSTPAPAAREADRPSPKASECPYQSTARTVTGEGAFQALGCEAGVCVLLK
ncbi:MAG: hypothetical protein AB1730_06305 [Myxococcota bacterium]|jgi:hypothetical protein